MILVRLKKPLTRASINHVGPVSFNFGLRGELACLVDRSIALQIEHTYPSQYRAVEVPEGLTLKGKGRAKKQEEE